MAAKIKFCKAEKKRLNDKSSVFFDEKAMTIDRKQMLMVVNDSIDFVRGPRVLELGYTDRGWTDAMLERGFNLTVIEGSAGSVRYAKKKYGKGLDIRRTLFEEFKPDCRFNTVLMSCILEHVANPVSLIKKASKWLAEDGRLVIIVPNKYSLHRRIGYYRGIIKSMDELGVQDLEVGHRRHYAIDDMLVDIEKAGLKGRFEKGIFLKPLSSMQMMEWPDDLLLAFNEAGRSLPEWSAFILFIAEKK